jgi:hypothetical protein
VLGWCKQNGCSFLGIYPPANPRELLRIAALRDDQGMYLLPEVLRPAAMLSEKVNGLFGDARAKDEYPSWLSRFVIQSDLFVACRTTRMASEIQA